MLYLWVEGGDNVSSIDRQKKSQMNFKCEEIILTLELFNACDNYKSCREE